MSGSPGRAILVLPVAVYAATIPLVANLQIDRNIRLLLYQNRSYVILAAVALAIFALVVLAPRRVAGALGSPWHRQLIVASLLFPAAFAAGAVIKGRIDVPVIGLYVVWAAAGFFVAPLLFDTPARLRSAVAALLVANAFAWLLGFYLYSTAPQITTFEERESFGYSNPNTYAQILQVMACSSAYLLLTDGGALTRKRPVRILLAGVCVLAGLSVIAAQSRNVMAFGVSAVAGYLLLRGRRGRWLLTPLLIAGVALVSVVALTYTDLTEVDRFSSGRLTLWGRTVDEVFVSGDNARALLIGRDRELSRRAGGSRRYSDIRETAAFEKYHVDNFYLELMVEAGLIGTLLFLWPYVLLSAMLWRLRRRPGERVRANLGLAFLIGLAVQGVFSSTIPSFNNPIGFAFAIVTVSMLAAGMRRRVER